MKKRKAKKKRSRKVGTKLGFTTKSSMAASRRRDNDRPRGY